jgi:hypothetical protein
MIFSRAVPATIEGVLEGRLQERFYRFENLKPGESLNIFVQMESNTTASVSMLMLYEIRDRPVYAAGQQAGHHLRSSA